jgi:hypothetical protein
MHTFFKENLEMVPVREFISVSDPLILAFRKSSSKMVCPSLLPSRIAFIFEDLC